MTLKLEKRMFEPHESYDGTKMIVKFTCNNECRFSIRALSDDFQGGAVWLECPDCGGCVSWVEDGEDP